MLYGSQNNDLYQLARLFGAARDEGMFIYGELKITDALVYILRR
jgi:hypothetical protein